MEILKRAKSGGEVIPWNENENNVREEVLRRNARAGYCNSDGTPVGAGKGDCYRSVDRKKYKENYEKVFGHE